MGKKYRSKRLEKEQERQAAGGDRHVPKKFKQMKRHGRPKGR
jgi:hypothetical protein